MTLRRLEALMRHWKQSPPVHVSVAAYLGMGRTEGKANPTNEGLMEALAAVGAVRK